MVEALYSAGMRLADFILANTEPILVEWESFARTIWPPGVSVEPAELRNDAGAILHAAAADMQSSQTGLEQSNKSKGIRHPGDDRDPLNRTSVSHGTGRATSGLHLWALIAEYRALRASVLRLWQESRPEPDRRDLEDMTRFNESIDQSLTHAVSSYAAEVDRGRNALLASERTARRDADEANRSKDLFLATLGHELRTPLNAIVGWVSILRRNPRLLEEGLTVIERNTGAQVQLISDLLDVSRIVSGKLRVDIQPSDLVQVIDAGVNAVRTAAEARNISLSVHLDPSARIAPCDSARIQQVVWNLVSNAIKFTPKGGEVRVSLTRQESSFQIEVSDTGLGISSELLPHVFERFRQADSSMRRKFAGLGLGLSIVKYIAEAHGGTVEAQSAGEGKGATFTVRLPIQAVQTSHQVADAGFASDPNESEPADLPSVNHPPPVRLDGVRVLVVDDEPDARQVLAMVLEQVGAVVTTVESARAAIETLPGAHPHVLVSDLGMPDRDGLDLIRHLRNEGHDAKRLPALALTAFVQSDDARLALSAGFQVHLSKPVDPHELTSAIAKLAANNR